MGAVLRGTSPFMLFHAMEAARVNGGGGGHAAGPAGWKQRRNARNYDADRTRTACRASLPALLASKVGDLEIHPRTAGHQAGNEGVFVAFEVVKRVGRVNY